MCWPGGSVDGISSYESNFSLRTIEADLEMMSAVLKFLIYGG